VQRLLEALAAQPPADTQALNQLIRQTSREVRLARVADTERADMHCTVVCLVLDFVDQLAWWAHAGDSRLYWFRGGRLLERTRDHSLVQTLLDAGLLEPDQLRTHPRRSELRSALGTDDSVLEVEDSGTPRAVEPGDAFLLCTDGIWEHLEDDMLEAVLVQAGSPREWLQALEAQVRAAALDKPDHDNFTALAVWTAALSERT
jgi:serine/threonine protein phosphatase PrpC